MSRISPFALGLALPITLLSQAALADLTPAQVWGDWRGYMEGMGYEVSASETARGDTLSVTNITLSFATPDNEGSVTMALDVIDFVQNGDGTVAIILPDTMPLAVTGKGGPSGDQDMNMRMSYTQTGQAMMASGTPEAMTYALSAQTFGVALEEMKMGNDTLADTDVRFGISGTNLTSATSLTTGDLRRYDQTGSIDDLTYDLFVKSPDGDESQAAIKGNIGGIRLTGNGAIPPGMEPGSDMSKMLAAGFDIAGGIAFARGNSEFDIQDPENGNYVMKTASQGGEFGVKMGAAGLAYDVAQTDVDIAVQVEGMPFPFEVKMAESAFNLAMPVTKSDENQDFAFGIRMGDLTMSDIIWGMFDPSGQLPRDPATVILDLTGKAKLLVDWMDPDAIAGLGARPGEVKEITLGNLLIDAAGAKFEGTGDVAFDGAASGLVPGVGNPVGAINLALAGGNGLLDKLVGMGLLPSDQAMGARMMMGLFTVPGDAPDTLKSKIEFTQDGQILANGQRLR